VDVDGQQETLTFWWKVSSEEGSDFLHFYINEDLQHEISGEVGWQLKSYDISEQGSHTLKWVYSKDYSIDQDDDCGWVDYVQWTGSPDPTPDPPPDPTKWKTIDYTYDPAGRRIKKAIDDDYSLKYVYDGGNVIAEYDHDNFLLRKYIYGPGVDEPVCMLDVVDNDAEYYYHYDGLGSVVALSDSNGDTVQTYEYSVYGQVAASDPNFLTNPYLFTGRRFDIETGLYYYRARYYNPYMGRFLQTDPVGYGAGMNLYAYCGNGPLNFVDPSGLYFVDVDIPLQTIWHQSSMGAYIKGKYVTEENDPQHETDVQCFLDDSNFDENFPRVTLDSVTFSGSSEEGTYHCVFEVPDEYTNMDMDVDDSLCGIPILAVETGRFFNRESVNILDYRLLGMLDDKLHGIQVSDPGGALHQKFLTDLLTIIGTYSNDLYLGAMSQGISVITFYYTVAYPNSAVPNFSTLESYYTYIENSAEGGYDGIFNTKYDDYKAKYGHLNKF